MNFTHDSTEAFDGILWAYRGGWITLKDVSALKATLPPTEPTRLPGEIVIHRSQISYLQVSP